jgi:N-acetylneuraminate lyase
MGAHGGIGSTYNIMPATFAAIYRAYRAGDLASAQHFQYRANRVIKVLLGVPYFATLKGILSAWGVPCGAPRRPNRPFASADEANASIRAMLNAGLEQLETDAMAFLR